MFNGVKLHVLRHHRRRCNHGSRHRHGRIRFGRERWRQPCHVDDLRRLHWANRSSAQTHGGLGTLCFARPAHEEPAQRGQLAQVVPEGLLPVRVPRTRSQVRKPRTRSQVRMPRIRSLVLMLCIPAGAGACRRVSGFVLGLVNAFNSSATSPRKEAHCGRLTCRRNAAAVSKARRRRQRLELPHPRFLFVSAPCARPDMWARSSSASRCCVPPWHSSRPSAQAPLIATGKY